MSQVQAPAVDHWYGGACPFNAGWRKVMMWIFIITDGLLFAGFLAGYGYCRLASHNWPNPLDVASLGIVSLMTFVLITSSATMASAVAAARAGRRSMAGRFILFTILGGLVFLGCQAFEWTHVIHEGGRLASNPWGDPLFGSFFFVVTGFHGTHVLSGIVILALQLAGWSRGRTTAETIEMGGLYWHFVDLVWVFIFTLFYLV